MDEGSFLCESCDRSWETAEELEEHTGSHVSCSAEGCSFSAHPKLVELHFKLQHVTGLFERIPRSSDSKEIEAWIAERRKRYPTKSRVEIKEAEKLEKVARGEVLEDSTSRPKLSAEPKDIRSRKHNALDRRTRNPPRELQKRMRAPPRFVVGGVRIEIVDGLPPDYEATKRAMVELATTADEVEAENFDISEDEWDVECTPNQDSSKGMCSVLSALCAAYDSNCSDDDGPPTETKAIVKKAAGDTPSEKCSTGDTVVKTEEPVEEKRASDGQPDKQNVAPSRKRMRKRTVKEDSKKPYRRLPHPSSFLQKLLAKDIRKERNQILQCIRFIVENRYFDSSKS